MDVNVRIFSCFRQKTELMSIHQVEFYSEKMHFLNSAVKMSTERGRGRLVKISPTAHIDGMAAVIDAMTVRQKWYAEIGKQLENNKRE